MDRRLFDADYYYGQKRSNYGAYDHLDNLKHWQPVLTLFERHHIQGSILDIGCAFGYFLKYAAPGFNSVSGADISEFAVEKAGETLPRGQFITLDLDTEELPFPDESFDIVTAFDVLEHTKSIAASMKKIYPKIKKGGYLLFSVPVKDTWAGRIFTLFDKDVTHISVPTKQELASVIESSGMEFIEQTSFFVPGDSRIPFIPVTHEVLLRRAC